MLYHIFGVEEEEEEWAIFEPISGVGRLRNSFLSILNINFKIPLKFNSKVKKCNRRKHFFLLDFFFAVVVVVVDVVVVV